MLNKKGFTIAEVIVSFSLVSVILASMVGTTIYYRDKVKEEEVVTQLTDFKNMITTMIYDDILAGDNKRLVGVERCINADNCIEFIDKGGTSHTLKVVEYTESGDTYKKGVYLSYNNSLYMLPDSDLGIGVNRVCDFMGGFGIDYYHDTTTNIDLYTVKISFMHKDLNKQYDIMLTITS